MVSKPVVLIGPMGVGKTTIGKKLAKRLGLRFVDTDALITLEHGAIVDIFANEGEEQFRRYEEFAVAEACKEIQVVATGGGSVLSGANQRVLENTTVIYLSTNGQHMRARLENGSRPLLKDGLNDWRRIYGERRPLYERIATFEIDPSATSLSRTLDLICERLEGL
jgi:shikimate kinase